MSHEELFIALDLDHDGNLSRNDLHCAAQTFGWHWHQAPFFALMDFLTLRAPLSKEEFVACMDRISVDPQGIYGEVLNRGAGEMEFIGNVHPGGSNLLDGESDIGPVSDNARSEKIPVLLDEIVSDKDNYDYTSTLEQLQVSRLQVRTKETALLVIDPQRSFASGAWMQSLGPIGYLEVLPICQAFENCADLLRSLGPLVEIMFTRCPFPPDSYGWDERFAGIVENRQPYFIKPGNNVLMPSGNGFRRCMEQLMAGGRDRLVLGGCTLTSCVRVSSVEILRQFREKGLEVIIDLSLCGARTRNYLKSDDFGGISAVQAALREMIAAGVKVADCVAWC